MSETVILAFSGGLDTSYCVPYLRGQGWDVVTLFVDTGGGADLQAIERRALELGAREHFVEDASRDLWEQFVAPFVMGGALYQGRYPLLCSDRYVITARMVEAAERLGAAAVAHGCTAMGNDQVRFDQSLRCLTSLPILAPIRELQGRTRQPRAHEMAFLRERGFDVAREAARYSVNENLLGATISGSEIDGFEAPREETRRMTAPPDERPREALRLRIGFEHGEAVSVGGERMAGEAILARLNESLGACGVGRGIYTGDTVIGLKGRIVFEAPGLTGLLEAHRALEELVLTREQNAFKPVAARQWSDLVYRGLFFEPLRSDLEAFIRSTQRRVTGEVTLETRCGLCAAVAVTSPYTLVRVGATYAQSADWSAADAAGFIKLSGLSSATWAEVGRGGAHAAPAPAQPLKVGPG